MSASSAEVGRYTGQPQASLAKSKQEVNKMKNKLGTITVAILVVFAMFQIAVAQAPKDSWLSRANMPSTREGLTVTPVDGKIYAIAGYGIVGGVFVGDTNITQEYNPATDTWTNKTPAPTIRAELTAAAHANKIYVLGGRSIGVLNTNEIYDVSMDTWSTGAPMPTARAGLASAALGNKIYAIGGRTTTGPRPVGAAFVLSTVEVYDIATDTWTAVAPLSVPRSDLVAVAHGGNIYAIGGWNGTIEVGTVEVYDPTTDTWTSAASMPTARSNLVADVKGNTIYAIGGYTGVNLNTNEAYDIAKGTWSAKAPMITARSEMDSARVGDKIYVIGGGIFGALTGGNLNEAYIAG